MRKLFILLTLAPGLQQAGSVHAQIPLRYRDTTVTQGSAIVLGLQAPPTSLVLQDYFSPVLDIGFPFVYFDTTYTKCVLSGNNFISFDTTMAGTYSPFIYNESQNAGRFKKAILFPFHDVDPSFGGYISYMRTGTAPHRKFIVEFCKVPLFFCGTLPPVTDQLILNEGSNTIEMHITTKTGSCNVFNGNSIQGLKNGAIQILVPGRDNPAVQWSATNEATRFTPAGPNNYTISAMTFQPWQALRAAAQNQVAWYDENNVQMGTGPSVTVTPGANTHYYTARYTGQTGCDSVTRTFIDTVHVQATIPLPLHLTGFTGTVEGLSHLLSWKIAGEEPAETYILQHSADAVNYKDIYKTGVQRQQHGTYVYSNENPEPGNNYYRLKMLTAGGQQSLSPVVQLRLNETGANILNVYPNPAAGHVNIVCGNGLKLQQVVLTDVTGNVKCKKQTGTNTTLYTLSLKDMPSGLYYLKAVTDKGVITKSITVTQP